MTTENWGEEFPEPDRGVVELADQKWRGYWIDEQIDEDVRARGICTTQGHPSLELARGQVKPAAGFTGIACSRGTIQTQLPLGPPGSGRGVKNAPAPTPEGFAKARATEASRARPSTDEEVHALDVEKLRALCDHIDNRDGEGLYDGELESFPDMLKRTERSSFALTDKQRTWVDKALDRCGIEVDHVPDLAVPGEYIAPTRPADVRKRRRV